MYWEGDSDGVSAVDMMFSFFFNFVVIFIFTDYQQIQGNISKIRCCLPIRW